jgi:hypothetical protein
MKNELNTDKSQPASRKSCSFALGVTLLSMSLFASAAHAQSSCAPSLSGANLAAICQETGTSGTVWVAINGVWSKKMYYYTADPIFIYTYHYDENLWCAQNRTTGEMLVQAAPGQSTYIPYAQYEAETDQILASLAGLAQATGNTGVDVTSSAPTITIIPRKPFDEYCSAALRYQQELAAYGAPTVPIGLPCGQ